MSRFPTRLIVMLTVLAVLMSLLPVQVPRAADAPDRSLAIAPDDQQRAQRRALQALRLLDVQADAPDLDAAGLRALAAELHAADQAQQAHQIVHQPSAAGQEVDRLLSRLDAQIAALAVALEHGSDPAAAAAALRATTRALLAEPEQRRPAPPDTNLLPGPLRHIDTVALAPVSAAVSTDRPSEQDITSSEDAPLDPAISALAEQLGRDPLRIANHVRRTISFDPYQGSKKGALLTLWERRGNDVDTASLLIALLRASGYPARYRSGTVVLTAQQAREIVGGMDSVAQAARLFDAALGAAVTPEGNLTVTHTWVEFSPVRLHTIYLPQIKRGRGRFPAQPTPPAAPATWIPLAPAIKRYSSAAPPSPQPDTEIRALLDEANGRAGLDLSLRSLGAPLTTASADGANADTPLGMTLARRAEQAAAVFAAANPTMTLDQALGTPQIVADDLTALPTELPFALQGGADPTSFAQVPDSLRWTARFQVLTSFSSTTPLISHQSGLPALAGRRITVSYEPADETERAKISGTTILSAPVDLEMVPVLRINGREVGRAADAAAALDTGRVHRLILTAPNGSSNTSDNRHSVGEMVAFVIAPGLSSGAEFARGLARLNAALPVGADGLPDGDSPAAMDEAVVGEVLNLAMRLYFAQSSAYRDLAGRTSNVRHLHTINAGFGRMKLAFERSYRFSTGDPIAVLGAGFGMDVPLGGARGVARDGSADAVRLWRMNTGKIESVLEHAVFEWFGAPALSTIRILNTALERGQTLYQIDARNRATALPKLQLSSAAEADIAEYLDAGYMVTAHDRTITIGAWSGAGYSAVDPDGFGSFLIFGGLGDQRETLLNGGSQSDFFNAAMFALGFAMAVDSAAAGLLLAATAIGTGGLLGVAVGVGLGVLTLGGLAESGDELLGFFDRSRSDPNAAGDYGSELLANKLADTAYKRFGGRLVREALDALPDGVFRRVLDQAGKETKQALGKVITKGVDELTGVTEWMSDRIQDSYPPILDFATQDAARTQQLAENTFALDERVTRGVARAATRAQEAPGKSDLVGTAVQADDYGASYALQRAAAYTRADGTTSQKINRYRPSVTVNYQPVTGFDAAGQPVRGAQTTGTFRADFELDGTRKTWVMGWYLPPGARDLRYWNQIALARAAITQHSINVRLDHPYLQLPSGLAGFRGSVAVSPDLRDWLKR